MYNTKESKQWHEKKKNEMKLILSYMEHLYDRTLEVEGHALVTNQTNVAYFAKIKQQERKIDELQEELTKYILKDKLVPEIHKGSIVFDYLDLNWREVL